MRELEEIKARSAEYRSRFVSERVVDDLDRVITIAEQAMSRQEADGRSIFIATQQRDIATQQRDQARVDVLKLHDVVKALQPINMDNEGCLCVLHKDCDICRALDALWKLDLGVTEHYEQYR